MGWNWQRHFGKTAQVDDVDTEASLMALKKDKLIERATALDLQLTGDETKADLAAAILAK